METYGATSDAWDFIVAAYCLGFLLIFGFGAWLVRQRLALRRLQQQLQKDKGS